MSRHLFADIFNPENLSLYDRVLLGLVSESELQKKEEYVEMALDRERLIQELEAFMIAKSIYFEVMLK